MTKEIQLTQGKVALVDDEDYEWLNQWKWQFNSGYATRSVTIAFHRRRAILMHRIIAKTPIGMETDHISGNKLDNRKANLRICTHSQNLANQGKPVTNTSGYKGVCWHRHTRKWNAQIKVNGKNIHLGLFVNSGDAAKAYENAASYYFEKYAHFDERP